MATTAEQNEILIQTDEMSWGIMGDGIGIKVLRVSEETGQWTALIRQDPGSVFAPHKHLGAADFHVLKGAVQYRMGEAPAGSYAYEPLGANHDETTCSEETVYLFTAYGPVVFYNEDGSVAQILSHENILEIVDGTAQNYAADRPKSAA